MIHQNKCTVVTGAADGIGRATCLRLASEGAVILAVDTNAAGLTSLLEANPGNIHILNQDVTEATAAKNICQSALDHMGIIDFLINIAGVVPQSNAAIESLNLSEWRRVLGVNLDAVFSLCQQAIPHLKNSERGRIVNIGSIMSTFVAPSMGPYTASKQAIAGLTKTLAVELGGAGITANYIMPGAIVTGITKPIMDAGPEFEAYWQEKTPLGRMGQAKDIASGINFLLSDDAAFITGHGLMIDGGVTLSV